MRWWLVLLLLPGAQASWIVTWEEEPPVWPAGLEVERMQHLPMAIVDGDPSLITSLTAHTNTPLQTHVDLARMAHGATITAGVAETGQGVTVAVVDNGIDSLHPGFNGRLQNFQVTSDGVNPPLLPVEIDSHGTHVAGIIGGDGAGSPDNRYRGVAPGVDLVGLDLSADFTTANAVRAFDWLLGNHEAQGIRIVSNSWGRSQEVDGVYDPRSPLVLATQALTDEGMLVVYSAGNRGGASSMDTEALNPVALTVGASDVGGSLASFSSQGPGLYENGTAVPWTKPDIVAVGDGVIGARGGLASVSARGERSLAPLQYATETGTSMAAAVASGVAALMLEADPTLTPEEIISILRATAIDVGPAGVDHGTGWGFIDASLAVETAKQGRLIAGQMDTATDIEYDYTVLQALGLPVRLLPAMGLPSGTGFAALSAVPPHATSVRFEMEWGSVLGAGFQADAVSPAGVRHPLTGNSVLSVEVDRPEPGPWRLQVTPASGVYETQLHIEAAVETARQIAQGLTLRAIVDQTTTAVPFEEEDTPFLPPWLVLGALLLARKR